MKNILIFIRKLEPNLNEFDWINKLEKKQMSEVKNFDRYVQSHENEKAKVVLVHEPGMEAVLKFFQLLIFFL